jgi:hypothetical protein
LNKIGIGYDEACNCLSRDWCDSLWFVKLFLKLFAKSNILWLFFIEKYFISNFELFKYESYATFFGPSLV